MSVIDAIDAFDKLEYDDTRSFEIASAVIAKSVQLYNENPSMKSDALKLLYEIDSSDVIQQQKAIENEWSDTNHTSIPFTTILDSCLGSLSSSVPKHTFEQSLYLPFRSDQTIQYEPINWQSEPSVPLRFIVQPTSPNQILKTNNEPNIDNQTNTVIIDDNDDKNYIDTNGDEENQAPKVVIKKKAKKKKQTPQVNTVETTTDSAATLNTSSNRTSTTGYKHPQKLSSKWSSGKRISGIGVGKTSAIRKFARPSNDRQNRGDSRTLFRNKPSVTTSANRLSQEQREQLARAAEERKQEERKRKIEKLHEQAKKREEVLNRAKMIQQDKEQKNQLRISDNQSKTANNTTINQIKKVSNNNNSTLANNSMNESTAFIKTTGQQQYKPVVLDTTSNKIFTQNKIIKNPLNTFKKPTTNHIVDKNHLGKNDMTVSLNAQSKADWTILPTPGANNYDELELDSTMTRTYDGIRDYGIEDVCSDQDSDNDDEDEARIPSWAKEHLLQTFWQTQGHWYLSRRVLKLTRRTFGHYPVIKDELQVWLRELKSSKPLSETFSDATYLDQTQAYF